MTIKSYNKISELADKYDVFFVDLWGVIHDGSEAYPGVQQALADIKNAGKKIIFISNAPRRSIRAVEGLRRFGIGEDMYAHVITSGEVVFEQIRAMGYGLWEKGSPSPLALRPSPLKYLILGPERDAALLDGTDYIMVQNAAEADFVIVTGYDEDDSKEDEKMPYLKEAIKKDLPLICANPDLAIVRITGVRALCAGVIAQQYADMGGKVMQFGKPYKEVYEKAMELAGNHDKSRVAAIGDSLITDILGANNFGIDSYLIPGGILGAELGTKHGQLPQQEKLEEVCKNYNILPTGVLPEFVY